MYFTYILKWSNGKYYVGYTWDIQRRLSEHTSKNNSKYTASMWEVELIGYFEYSTKKEAIIQENKIKRSGHISRYIDYQGFKTMGY